MTLIVSLSQLPYCGCRDPEVLVRFWYEVLGLRRARSRGRWLGGDRAARRVRRSEGARMIGDLGGNAFAVGQPGPDELVGAGPLGLGAGRSAGGPLRLARRPAASTAHRE